MITNLIIMTTRTPEAWLSLFWAAREDAAKTARKKRKDRVVTTLCLSPSAAAVRGHKQGMSVYTITTHHRPHYCPRNTESERERRHTMHQSSACA